METRTDRKCRRACVTFKYKGEDSQGICVTFTRWKVGQFHLEKDPRKCGSPHKIGVIHEIKGKKELYS